MPKSVVLLGQNICRFWNGFGYTNTTNFKDTLMNENNELNDIILKKNSSASSSKKIILAVATLGIILIIVIMLMNSLSSSGIDNLPKASLPPQPQTQLSAPESTQEPLFEDVEVEHEGDGANENLEQIAQKLKEESTSGAAPAPKVQAAPKKELPKQTQAPKQPQQQKVAQAKQPVPKQETKKSEVPQINKLFEPVKAQKTTPKAPQKAAAAPVAPSAGGNHYIQVGSFSKYEPNKKFLSSITSLGYNYRYKEANNINKVLVGPFKTLDEAKEARKVLRAKIEPGAFLTTFE